MNVHGLGPPSLLENIATQNTNELINRSAVNPPNAPFTNSAATKENRSKPVSDAKFAKKALSMTTPRMASIR